MRQTIRNKLNSPTMKERTRYTYQPLKYIINEENNDAKYLSTVIPLIKDTNCRYFAQAHSLGYRVIFKKIQEDNIFNVKQDSKFYYHIFQRILDKRNQIWKSEFAWLKYSSAAKTTPIREKEKFL